MQSYAERDINKQMMKWQLVTDCFPEDKATTQSEAFQVILFSITVRESCPRKPYLNIHRHDSLKSVMVYVYASK
jgi:hypothetical protein